MTQVEVISKTYPTHLLATKPWHPWDGGYRDKLMATESVFYHSAQAVSLDDLSTELLVLIFEQLRDIDSRALASIRQLSRRFEAIAAPIQFDTICLNERIIAPQTSVYFPQILRYIYLFARHVEVRSDLDPINTRRVLDRVQRLSSLRWRYVGAQPHSGFFSTPSDILSSHQIKINQVRLHVADLPLKDFDRGSLDTYLRAMPSSNLVSLKMTSPTPPLTTQPEPLKQLLIEAQGIRTLYYSDRGQGTRFSFKENERLPAFEELSLRSYDWNHNVHEVRKHWDFSRLQHLTLLDVPMFQFLSSVPFETLHQLRTLHVEDFSAHLPNRRQETTRSLYALTQQIKALHTLKITCHMDAFPVCGLLRHADSLRVLRFRDYVGFGDERQRCPTMLVESLTRLSRNLIHLRSIELDMDAALCEPVLFLRALCNFARLETLVLHTQTVLDPFDIVRNGVDPDYETAMGVFSALITAKQGKPWRSITINVGGWKPAMVRRFSEAWRAQNRRGFYAERCFVLERKGDAGEITIREETGLSNFYG
ncbi:hypothetical protein F5Y05DRAFT_296509 [Hypoxylon sp. FL0543]|nr:hypothetical protein F5Y05DRAFT_296509 [Hypoxylon sp. FL0543]